MRAVFIAASSPRSRPLGGAVWFQPRLPVGEAMTRMRSVHHPLTLAVLVAIAGGAR
jgi:hypothetical protein